MNARISFRKLVACIEIAITTHHHGNYHPQINYHIKHICRAGTAALLFFSAVTLPSACAQPPVQSTFNQRDDEPNELSWQYFSTARLPFEDFTSWWQQRPESRRDAVLSAAEKQGMLKLAPAQTTALWVQGEAFQGGDWKRAQTDGRTSLQHGGGHTGSAATVIVDIPQAGTYRLWSHWWNLPGYHNSFEVRVRPLAVAGFQYGWQQAVQGDYLEHRFAWSWFQRKTSTSVSYDADKKGYQWESSPMFDLPQGKVLITMAPLISGGPYTARNVDSFLLTQDPLLVPGETAFPDSNPEDAKSLVVSQQQPAAGSPDQQRLWNIRPGAVALSEAPAEVAGIWREWRDAFIGRLAEGKNLSNVEQAAAEKTYFDARWNLVGTPAMVKERAAQLQSANTVVSGFIQWIEAENFKIDKGWKITNDADTGGTKILRAGYGNGLAQAAYTTSVTLAGQYRMVDAFVLTDNAQYQPDNVIEPVPATVLEDSSTLFNAAQKGEAVAWIAKSWTTPLNSRWAKEIASDWMPKDNDMWTGFRMTDWPKKTDQIATSSAVQVSVQPGAMENRVLHFTKIRIWANPGERKGGTPQAIADMSPYVDVYCPYINHWDEKDANYQKLLTTLGETKLIYTTPCFEEKSPQAPLEMLSLAAASLQYKRDGWDAFALRCYYPYTATAWDEVNAPFADQAVSMYPGAWDQVIGSRNLEAVRVAVQRWKTAQVGD